MTNKELLAELKVCYEYINDIRENHENRFNGKEEDMLWNIREQIDSLYQKVYQETLTSEFRDDDLKVRIGKDFGDDELFIGRSVDADYNFVKKGTSDFYDDDIMTCGDLGYYWYYDVLGFQHSDWEYNIIANGLIKALDVISDLSNKANVKFDYFDTTCNLLCDFSNSRVLDFLDKFGSDNDEDE